MGPSRTRPLSDDVNNPAFDFLHLTCRRFLLCNACLEAPDIFLPPLFLPYFSLSLLQNEKLIFVFWFFYLLWLGSILLF